MMNGRLAVILTLSALFVSIHFRTGAADADSRRQNWENLFTRRDANKDGNLSREEFPQMFVRFFDRIDTDKDGFVSREEYAAFRRARDKRGRGRPVPGRSAAKTGSRAAKDTAGTIGGLRIPDGVRVVPDIAYRPGKSKAWRLDLAMPDRAADHPMPAIVFVHGGGWRSGDKRRAPFLGAAMEFAAKGYVCISVEYRLVGEAPFPACIEDVKCAVRWLRAHAKEYNVDPERIGAYGNSAGAHLVSMLGLCPKSAGLEGDGPWQEYSSSVQAVVASATPTSFLVPMNKRQRSGRTVATDRAATGPRRTQRFSRKGSRAPQAAGQGGRSARSLPEEMRRKISPITYVSADAPPFLLIHEVSDPIVGIWHSDDLVKALREAGAKDVTYMRLEDGSGHGAFMRNIEKAGPAREAFFARTLRKK